MLGCFRRTAVAHHDRHIRAIQIRVQQAYLRAGHSQRDSQVDGDGSFAHSALHAADRENILHIGQEILLAWERCRGHRRRETHLNLVDSG